MNNTTPKSESKPIMLRVNQDTLDQIDALVRAGRYKDRVDVARSALDRFLHETRARSEAVNSLREQILCGETRRGKLVFEVPEKNGVGTVYHVDIEP